MTCAWMATVDDDVSTAISPPSASMRELDLLGRHPLAAAAEHAHRDARQAVLAGGSAAEPERNATHDRDERHGVVGSSSSERAARRGSHARAVGGERLAGGAHSRGLGRGGGLGHHARRWCAPGRPGTGARRGAGRPRSRGGRPRRASKARVGIAEHGLVEANLLGLAGDGLELLQEPQLEAGLGAGRARPRSRPRPADRREHLVDHRLQLLRRVPAARGGVALEQARIAEGRDPAAQVARNLAARRRATR